MSASSAQSHPSPTAEVGDTGRNRWVGLAVLALAVAMIVLDGTIVGVALPDVVVALRLNLTDAQRVNSVYSVIFAALLLTSGRLGDRLGRRNWLSPASSCSSAAVCWRRRPAPPVH